MQVRLPWILSRKRLIIAALIDSIMFIVLYFQFFYFYFEYWPGFSSLLVLLLIVWMLSSYVAGRFASGDSSLMLGNGLTFVRQITRTIIIFLLALLFASAYLWFFNQNPAENIFRGFLLPFLGVHSILSFVVQFLFYLFTSVKASSQSHHWSFVGSSSAFDQLQQLSKWSRIPVNLVHVFPSQLTIHAPSHVVFEEIVAQDLKIGGRLLELQQNGSIVLTRFDWCEAFLQRFPSICLMELDLLRGRFSIPFTTFQARLKRVGDLLAATLLLIITSPLIVVSGLLIKLNDGGPIFYSQIRTGLTGRPYRIWKLRTMRIDAEQEGAQWALRSDSRITAIGAILRQIRFDELPQLWCVLNGTMSLIGPRPERPEIDQKLEVLIPFYRLRSNVRPGLSGWAQVNYPYGASIDDSANKLSYDLYYLRNFSFWLDLLILFKTIRLVFNAKGALPQK